MLNLKNQSSVSICIPTYNSEKFLKEMLDSIVSQTYKNIEVIISDNASVDKTPQIVREYCDKHNWKYFQNEVNIGAGANFNKLIELATGDYIAIYHADDVYEPTIVEESVNLFSKYDSIGLVSTLGYEINESDTITAEYKLPKVLKKNEEYKFDDIFRAILKQTGLFLITPSVMVKKEAYDSCGIFNLNDRYLSAGDYEMWFRILQKYAMGIIDKPLIKYRIHNAQGSQLEIRQNFKLPDSLIVYYDYMMVDKNKYLPLYNYTFYRLVRVLAIKYNNFKSFNESNKMINLIFRQTSSYYLNLFWLRILNYFKITINLNTLINIKKVIKL